MPHIPEDEYDFPKPPPIEPNLNLIWHEGYEGPDKRARKMLRDRIEVRKQAGEDTFTKRIRDRRTELEARMSDPQISIDLAKFDPADTSLDLTKPPARTYDVLKEVYFNELDLLKPLSQDVDNEYADRLRALGADKLAAQVTDTKRAELADMASRFFGKDSEELKAYAWNFNSCRPCDWNDFEIEDSDTEMPPSEILNAIERIHESRLFNCVSIDTVRRRRHIDKRLVTLGTISEDTREYAVFGIDHYGERYLLARWGTELPSMESLLAAEHVRQAEKDMAKVAEVTAMDDNERLIQAYEHRYAGAWQSVKKLVLIGTVGIVLGMVLVILGLHPYLIVLGAFLLIYGLAKSALHLHKHGRVETVRKVYGGKESLDRFLVNGQRSDYIYRDLQRISIDKRLRK